MASGILIAGTKRREIAGGYRLTTNNRMEMMAAIVALEALKRPCCVTVYSYSLHPASWGRKPKRFLHSGGIRCVQFSR